MLPFQGGTMRYLILWACVFLGACQLQPIERDPGGWAREPGARDTGFGSSGAGGRDRSRAGAPTSWRPHRWLDEVGTEGGSPDSSPSDMTGPGRVATGTPGDRRSTPGGWDAGVTLGPDSLAGRVLVVDAGHGGRDPGAIGVTGLKEKDFNLALAQQLAEALAACGADVVVTRASDKFLSLERRALAADATGCDLFVSIHADAAPNRDARGPTVYVAKGGGAAGKRVGEAIHANWRRAGLASRGVREARFKVLVQHRRPAVLVECGYLSNRRDEQLLRSGAYRDLMVQTIAAALVRSVGQSSG